MVKTRQTIKKCTRRQNFIKFNIIGNFFHFLQWEKYFWCESSIKRWNGFWYVTEKINNHIRSVLKSLNFDDGVRMRIFDITKLNATFVIIAMILSSIHQVVSLVVCITISICAFLTINGANGNARDICAQHINCPSLLASI